MSVRSVFFKIDKLLCAFLGLDKEEVRPQAVQLVGNQLIIAHSSSFKQHLFKEAWDSFSALNVQQTTKEDREKLGLAVGKALAKNLVVSFEETPIKD